MTRWRSIELALAALVCASVAHAQQGKEIPLWPQGAPGSEGKSGDEKVRVVGLDHVVSSIHRPTITPYLAPSDRNTGAAIIIAPGGGHRELWIDHEGYNPAQFFRDRGISAFVLKYRLAREEGSTYSIDDHALADMQRAIRLVRSNAAAWGIDTARIGVMGFSAGGEVAALSAMRPDSGRVGASDPVDRYSSRPAFQALIYPGNSSRYTVAKNAPPLFIVAGYNDRPDISKGMAELYLKYKEAGVPAELHVYANVGHGFGMREANRGAVTGWPLRLAEFLTTVGMTK